MGIFKRCVFSMAMSLGAPQAAVESFSVQFEGYITVGMALDSEALAQALFETFGVDGISEIVRMDIERRAKLIEPDEQVVVVEQNRPGRIFPCGSFPVIECWQLDVSFTMSTIVGGQEYRGVVCTVSVFIGSDAGGFFNDSDIWVRGCGNTGWAFPYGTLLSGTAGRVITIQNYRRRDVIRFR